MHTYTRISPPLTSILLGEHRSVDVPLTPAEVAMLQAEFGSRIEMLPTSTEGVYSIHAKQYAGFVVLPTGRVIEIRPKVRPIVLFAMLAKVHHLAEFRADPHVYTSAPDLFEFVVGFFVSMLEAIVARGILRSFEQVEDELLALRGKILFADTLRHRPITRDRHWCNFTEFTSDVLENRILTLTCHWLMPYPYRRLPDLSSRLRRLTLALAEVRVDPGAVNAFDKLIFNRLNEHYRPALALAKLLLSCLSPTGEQGMHQFLTFLVNMDTLFEMYVTTVLQESRVAQADWQVLAQDVHQLDFAGYISVRPDVVIKKGGKTCLAVDAKYKLDNPNTDIYQALAYCHALHVSKAILVYPVSERVAPTRHLIQPDGRIEVVVVPLNLAGDLDDLYRQTQSFTEAVWRETLSE